MKLFYIISFLFASHWIFAQPANKVYWVGPLGGANLNSDNWAVTSGGAAGSSLTTLDRQLVFDGMGVPGQTYTLNVNTTTGGFFRVINHTTVILQTNTSSIGLDVSGFLIDTGSKLVFENTGADFFDIMVSSTVKYNSVVAGEMVLKSPVLNCSVVYPFTCAQIWLSLDGFIMPYPPDKSLTVSGTLRMEGTKARIHGSPSTLIFAANSNFILDTDQTIIENYTFDPTSTVKITGAGKGTAWLPQWTGYLGSAIYGNIIYDCPSQTVDRTLIGGSDWTVNGDLIIKNTGSGKLKIANGTVSKTFTQQELATVQIENCTIDGDTHIQGGRTELNGTLKAKGNFRNKGEIKTVNDSANSLLQFIGSMPQSFFPGVIHNGPLAFVINNPAGISLSTDWTLPADLHATLTLTNGNIDMRANVLTLQNPLPAALVGGTATSHVLGKLRRATNTAEGTYVFPVSNSTTEAANVIIYPKGSTHTIYEVAFTRPNLYNRTAVPTGITNAGNYFWNINQVSGNENADVAFVYGTNNFNLQNLNPQDDLRVLHWNDNAWENLGGSGANGEIRIDNIAVFSPFTLGTAGPIGLPARLLSFIGLCRDNVITLDWTVGEETDVQIYEIEKSSDGSRFAKLAQVRAIHSSTYHRYSFKDNQPAAPVNYYRLKVIDKNDKVSYSQILAIKTAGKEKLDLYPNPASDFINVQVTTSEGRLFLYDFSGRTIKTVSTNQTGLVTTVIDISDLNKGVYLIKAGSESQLFIKQ